MVVKARRNLARNEGPPKSVVERNKTKDNKRPTTFYVMLFFLLLVVVSGLVEMQRHVKFTKSLFSRFR